MRLLVIFQEVKVSGRGGCRGRFGATKRLRARELWGRAEVRSHRRARRRKAAARAGTDVYTALQLLCKAVIRPPARTDMQTRAAECEWKDQQGKGEMGGFTLDLAHFLVPV